MATTPRPPAEGVRHLEDEAARFELSTELLPAEVFEKNDPQERSADAAITDIASSGDYTVVVRRTGKGNQQRTVLDTYDRAGKYHEMREALMLDCSWRSLLPGLKTVGGDTTDEVWFDVVNGPHRDTPYFIFLGQPFLERLKTDPAFARSMQRVADAIVGPDDRTQKGGAWGKRAKLQDAIARIERGEVAEPFSQDVRVKVVPNPAAPDMPYVVVRTGVDTTVYQQSHKDRAAPAAPEEWWLERGATTREVWDRLRISKTGFSDQFSEQQFFQDQGGPLRDLDLDAFLEEEKGLLTIAKRDGSDRVWSTDKARDFAIDPQDGQTIVFLNKETNTLDHIDPKEVQERRFHVTQRKVEALTGELREVEFDPNGNFILVHAWQEREGGGSGTLAILERDTLEKVREFTDVKGRVEVDKDGNVYYEDMQGRLRIVKTNFKNLPSGGTAAAREARREALTRVRSAIRDLRMEDLVAASRPTAAGTEEQQAAVISRDALVGEARNKLWELFGPRISAAPVDAIDAMRGQLAVLRSREGFAEVPEAFRPTEQALDERESALKTAALEERLRTFTEKLEGAGAETAIGLEREFSDLLSERARTAIADAEARSRVGAAVIRLRQQLDEKMAVFQEELGRDIGDRIDRVVDLINTMGSVEELQRLPQHPEFHELEERIVHLKDRETARGARQRLSTAIQEQRQRIEEFVNRERLAERERAAVVLDQTASMRDEVVDLIRREVKSVRDLDRWKQLHPLLTRHRATALALPEEVRRTEELALEELLAQARRELEYREQLGVPVSGKEVKFGEESFPVFEPPKIVWQPIVEPLAPGSAHGRLIFRDNLGRTFEPQVGSVLCDVSDPATKLMIERFTADADAFFNGQKRGVPAFDRRWKLTPYAVAQLGETARLLKRQQEQKSGILIIEGEAGTGKNVDIDMIAHFTNREVVTISCNALMEKEDLTTQFKYDPERGTYHLPSELVRAIQTPGTIIVFDEINTLPPGVTKMLNSLLDYRRTLNLPDEHRSVTAAPDVLFLGLQNPQHYIGTKKVAPEVLSRARVRRKGYPPEKNASGKRTVDEVVMMSAYLRAFDGLSDKEVGLLFDYVVNNDRGNGGDDYATPEREDLIKKMADVVHVASIVRKAYDDFHAGVSPEIVEIVFSLRESMDIASELTTMAARQAIKEVLLPKIGDPEQRRRVDALVDNA